MLSDHERKVLRELERQFTTEPEAVRSTTGRRVSRKHFETADALLIMTMTFLAVIMLLAGSLVGVLFFGSTVWLIWWARPSTDDTRQQPP